MKRTARNTTQIKQMTWRWLLTSLQKYSNDKIKRYPKVVSKFVCMIIQLFAKVVHNIVLSCLVKTDRLWPSKMRHCKHGKPVLCDRIGFMSLRSSNHRNLQKI